MDSVKLNHAVNKIDTMNQCVICFNQFKINNTPPSISDKMYKLCRKYLHSDIMKETLAAKWDLSAENSLLLFCQNCFESAVELNDLTEQMEFLQKSISELILMFSMGVLHRRSRTPNPTKKPDAEGCVKTKVLQVDCSGLIECDSWSASSSVSRFPTKEPYLELAVNTDDSKTNEFDDPLFGIPDEDDDNYVEIKNDDDMDEDDEGANGGKSPVYFPSAAYFTTEGDSKMPPVIHIDDVPPPMQKTVVISAGPSSQAFILSEATPAESSRHRRKTKLVPLAEVAEESNSSSNADSTAEKVSKRLYHLDPKSVQPGRDRRRVQKALNCYRYRLKKKQEAEQTIGKLNSDIENLKKQLLTMKQQNGGEKRQRR